jgi:glucuronoarabinoxylan endo-1,4-beta-xylanase
MMKKLYFNYFVFIVIIAVSVFNPVHSQTENVLRITPQDTFQTITGFGASLAYYEGWLPAHPNKAEIYDAIFDELSLDILRVRNSHGYYSEMMNTVKEFQQAAENSLGHPIPIMSTSWGPPAYLKSNNDKSNGGTLKYEVVDGEVKFNYGGFAQWWAESLDAYAANGIYPKYVSIQNEPDWEAPYESCLLRPSETVNSTDTIAGYNVALDSVYQMVSAREHQPLLLGPECIGIGYNAVQNYINALDVSKLHGIAHHLYHGAEEDNPFLSDNFSEAGNFHPGIPHFQTEYSRAEWFQVGATIFQSLYKENVVAYLYWDLIWTDGGGLVDLDFPWDRSRWKDPQKGYTRTKDYFVFKQFSAFIHPGWKRVGTPGNTQGVHSVAFINPGKDSATVVIVNESETESRNVILDFQGFSIEGTEVYVTSPSKNGEHTGQLTANYELAVEPRSITTVAMQISEIDSYAEPLSDFTNGKSFGMVKNYPNPFSGFTTIEFETATSQNIRLTVFDSHGREVRRQPARFFTPGLNIIEFQKNELNPGIYLFKLENEAGEIGTGRMVVAEE